MQPAPIAGVREVPAFFVRATVCFGPAPLQLLGIAPCPVDPSRPREPTRRDRSSGLALMTGVA